ncbi:hypothetical protein BST81_06210 [Leptolyngbya sp. 'hensonii']|uniref:phycobilisome linker polypeptide n=1 Tax=Leptolyngbya sp. 'hensonii' TaxID=1922337 RepID=UPI000950198B|nr:phycobilisome linker polypeptide [Leptolyngbya sp. 'hensonii']OLP19344.1 hypothetical protein BST81_06210 [Leptolyngbya sp. 'hensonii']
MAATGYDDLILVVEVAGLQQPALLPVSNFTFKVPYRSLARTLESIRRRQGKVVNITVLSSSIAEPVPAPDLSGAQPFSTAPERATILSAGPSISEVPPPTTENNVPQPSEVATLGASVSASELTLESEPIQSSPPGSSSEAEDVASSGADNLIATPPPSDHSEGEVSDTTPASTTAEPPALSQFLGRFGLNEFFAKFKPSKDSDSDEKPDS